MCRESLINLLTFSIIMTIDINGKKIITCSSLLKTGCNNVVLPISKRIDHTEV